MPSPRVRADYDGLAKISQSFSRQAAETERMIQSVRRCLGTLQGGDWVGQGAKVFYAEMDQEVLPSLNRLAAALSSAERVTRQVSQIMKEAEEEAARFFQIAFVGGGVSTLAGAAAAGLGGSAGAGSGGGSGEPAWRSNGLLARDPDGLFGDGYMRSLIGLQVQGAGSELRAGMNDLLRNPEGAQLDRALHRVAQLRGRPFEEISSEYRRFIDIRAQRDAADAPTPPNTSRLHPWFLGSNTNLRYGAVVGDAFGIDPVFGAMLNPTGGLVGPDNFSVAGDSTAVGYHGIVHDAAGYLRTYHGAGPGYNYLGLEDRDTTSPLSGQRAGIHYWRETLGGVDPLSYKAEEIMVDFVPAWDAANWVIDRAKGIF
ncbi:MAG TPA: WXG100 family type VII secretion target [Anaerolineales bacterium]|nr:WXG100 family type VII secretion target [Anaerolineales bacterium]